MNLNKARDFYSAHFEGTLDEGLRQAFERALAADAQVSAEYAQFVRIMQELKAAQTPVQVPAGLHLKIRERVDAHIAAEERQSKGIARFFAWRPIAYGAVATLAIIGAIASLSSVGGSASRAGVAAVSEAAPKIVLRDGSPVVAFTASAKNTVTVTDVASSRTLFSQDLHGQTIESPLSNKGDDVKLVSVAFAKTYGTLYVAVPGRKVSTQDMGAGTALDLAKAVAARYAVPVVVEAAHLDSNVTWKLESTDALGSINEELAALGLRADVREGGLVWISSN